MPVTAEEVREAYHAAGSMRAAGKALGISHERVRQILAASGGAERPLSQSDRKILVAIIAQAQTIQRGANVSQLAEKLGMPRRTVGHRVKRLRDRNLITSDPDNRGFLPTAEARFRL